MTRRPRPTLRHRLYRLLHPRAYRAGQLAEQRHQFADGPLDYTRTGPLGGPA